MADPRPNRWRTLAISYVLTNALVFALSRSAPMKYGLHELIGALFLIAGLISVRRAGDDTKHFGVRMGGIFPGNDGDDRSLVRALIESIPSALGELGIALAISLVVLPIYAWCWPLFNVAPAARHFVLDQTHVEQIATNVLAVALTEEIYFRGFVQTQIADALGVSESLQLRQRLTAMAIPIVATSVLFAITHVTVEVTVARAVVFFPALLFGTVRTWRRGIGAAVFLHAISNIFENWLEGK